MRSSSIAHRLSVNMSGPLWHPTPSRFEDTRDGVAEQRSRGQRLTARSEETRQVMFGDRPPHSQSRPQRHFPYPRFFLISPAIGETA